MIQEEGLLIWGINPVLEFMSRSPETVARILIQRSKKGKKIQQLIELARLNGIKIRFHDHLPFPDGFGAVNHQGVIAEILPFGYTDLDRVLNSVREDPAAILIALDTVQDPHNLGAIIRSAAAVGAAGVIVTKDRCAPLSGTVIKTSAGAIIHVPVCRVTNLATTLTTIKEAGLWIAGATQDGPLSLYQADLARPLCLVIGGEEKGIRPLVKKQCDLLISIPILQGIESLNASVAAAIILFEIRRQHSVTVLPRL